MNKLQEGNSVESFNLLRQAASTNNLLAQYLLGQCYEFGIGTDISLDDAFSMYRRAAERGLSPAMKDLSRCYYKGLGVQSNIDKAAYWQKRYESKPVSSDIPDMLAILSSASPLTPKKEVTLAENNTVEKEKHVTVPSKQPKIQSQQVKSQHYYENEKDKISFSDVDVNIPDVGIHNESTFALIVANENYQDVAAVANAHNDGEIFARYCNSVMGIPSSNIHFVKDATLNNIRRELNLMKNIAEVYNGEASFIIYYAGHGVPDEKTRKAYLMPIDGFTADLSTCLCLNDLYATLGEFHTKKIIFFIDACFSGSLRGEGMLASARGVAIKSKTDAPRGNTVVITSAQGDETAYPFIEQNHGLFTYYLLKKLKESKGGTTLGELVDFVRENVTKKAVVVNGKPQTPTAIPSSQISDQWYNWKF
ncbi:MAG: caspase family protein [Muribaculaceae bacterium]|nr:caspase family protein [Muribaculaceae bacterium]